MNAKLKKCLEKLFYDRRRLRNLLAGQDVDSSQVVIDGGGSQSSVTTKQRGDTAANWANIDPVLAERQIGLETDTQKYKVGDGVTAWNNLPYWTDAQAPANHDHDADYSPTGHTHPYSPDTHNHDTDYSPTGHTHPYSPDTHNHDTDYSPTGHTHPYSPDTHNHDADYSPTGHTHPYSPDTHNHDPDYSPTGHDHDADYSPIGHTHSGSGFLPGQIIWYSLPPPWPANWALCDGSETLNNTEYGLALMNAGYPFGNGESGACGVLPCPLLPNLVDKFILGGDNGDLGQTGGESQHTLTVSEMPSHQHEVDLASIDVAGSNRYGPVDWPNGVNSRVTSPTGGDQPHNNMPPYVKLYPLVYLGDTI